MTAPLGARRRIRRAQRVGPSAPSQRAERIAVAYEEVGQRLAAISLAAAMLEKGGDLKVALPAVRSAVIEARDELRRLRHEAALWD